jgi:hypothetical protein
MQGNEKIPIRDPQSSNMSAPLLWALEQKEPLWNAALLASHLLIQHHVQANYTFLVLKSSYCFIFSLILSNFVSAPWLNAYSNLLFCQIQQ